VKPFNCCRRKLRDAVDIAKIFSDAKSMRFGWVREEKNKVPFNLMRRK